MAEWVKAADQGQLTDGELLRVEAAGQQIVLARVDESVYALEDQCSHEALPLSNGFLEGDRLECMWHGAQFDVCTGRALSLPAIQPVRVFPVELRGAEIYVDVG